MKVFRHSRFTKSAAALPMARMFAACLPLLLAIQSAQAQGTAFTYQGELVFQDIPVEDVCDFSVGLWDAVSGGSNVGGDQQAPNTSVAGGRFTLSLDYGEGQWTGENRWLEIAVRCPAGMGNYTTLVPRQAVTPSPYAIRATSIALPAVLGGTATAMVPGLSVITAGGGVSLVVEGDGTEVAHFDGGVAVNGTLSTNEVETGNLHADGNTALSGPVNLTNSPLVTATNLNTTNLTTGNFECSDCVDSGDVDFPVYATRGDLVERQNSATLLPNATVVVTAICNDVNDLPLHGYCPVSNPSEVDLSGTDASNWTSTSGSAAYSCHYVNKTAFNRTVTAKIICLGVP